MAKKQRLLVLIWHFFVYFNKICWCKYENSETDSEENKPEIEGKVIPSNQEQSLQPSNGQTCPELLGKRGQEGVHGYESVFLSAPLKKLHHRGQRSDPGP